MSFPDPRLRETAGPGANWGDSRGFSLIELCVAILVLTVILGAMTQFMALLQQRYTREQRVAGVSQTGKTAMELLAIDIGQAGYYRGLNTPSGTTLTAAAITANNSSSGQAVELASAAGIYPEMVVVVDRNDPAAVPPVFNEEFVRVMEVSGTRIRGVFKVNHAAGVLVRTTELPYPDGILSPVYITVDPVTLNLSNSFALSPTGSDATTLKIMGDLRGDGRLRYIEYRYRSANDSATRCTADTRPCAVWRSDTCVPGVAGCAPPDISASNTQLPAVVVADNLWNDPNDTTQLVFTYAVPCRAGKTHPTFPHVTYTNASGASGTAPCLPGSSFFFTTSVTVNLIMRTPQPVEGPGGGPRQIVMRQTFVPRNVVEALRVSLDGFQKLLPVIPRVAGTPMVPVPM